MVKKKTVRVDEKGLEEGDCGGGELVWRVKAGLREMGVYFIVWSLECVCVVCVLCTKAYALHMIWKIHMLIG
jgi:hypothetical protein